MAAASGQRPHREPELAVEPRLDVAGEGLLAVGLLGQQAVEDLVELGVERGLVGEARELATGTRRLPGAGRPAGRGAARRRRRCRPARSRATVDVRRRARQDSVATAVDADDERDEAAGRKPAGRDSAAAAPAGGGTSGRAATAVVASVSPGRSVQVGVVGVGRRVVTGRSESVIAWSPPAPSADPP